MKKLFELLISIISRHFLIPSGADPGFWVRGGESWRGVWGPPRSPVRSRAEPWWAPAI